MGNGFPDWGQVAGDKDLDQLLREGYAFTYFESLAAVLYKHTMVHLLNPVGSNIDILFYSFTVKVGVTGNIFISRWTTLGGSVPRPTYNRNLAGGPASGIIKYGHEFSVTGDLFIAQRFEADIFTNNTPCMLWLPPGHAISVWLEDVNVGMDILLTWFETEAV